MKKGRQDGQGISGRKGDDEEIGGLREEIIEVDRKHVVKNDNGKWKNDEKRERS